MERAEGDGTKQAKVGLKSLFQWGGEEPQNPRGPGVNQIGSPMTGVSLIKHGPKKRHAGPDNTRVVDAREKSTEKSPTCGEKDVTGIVSKKSLQNVAGEEKQSGE